MKTVYRGQMPAPEYEHGQQIDVGSGVLGTVQHRRWTGSSWQYGLLIEGQVMIHWHSGKWHGSE